MKVILITLFLMLPILALEGGVKSSPYLLEDKSTKILIPDTWVYGLASQVPNAIGAAHAGDGDIFLLLVLKYKKSELVDQVTVGSLAESVFQTYCEGDKILKKNDPKKALVKGRKGYYISGEVRESGGTESRVGMLAIEDQDAIYVQYASHTKPVPQETWKLVMAVMNSLTPKEIEEGGVDQPATVPESKSEGKEEPKPEPEGRNQ